MQLIFIKKIQFLTTHLTNVEFLNYRARLKVIEGNKFLLHTTYMTIVVNKISKILVIWIFHNFKYEMVKYTYII